MIDLDDVRAYITSLDEYESIWCDEHGGVDASKICLKPERDMIAALLAEVGRLLHKAGECVCDSSDVGDEHLRRLHGSVNTFTVDERRGIIEIGEPVPPYNAEQPCWWKS